LKLHQTEDTWNFAVQKLRIWIKEEGQDPVQLFLMITFNRTRDLIRSSSIVEKPNDGKTVNRVLLGSK
jgi:ribosomal protein L19